MKNLLKEFRIMRLLIFVILEWGGLRRIEGFDYYFIGKVLFFCS